MIQPEDQVSESEAVDKEGDTVMNDEDKEKNTEKEGEEEKANNEEKEDENMEEGLKNAVFGPDKEVEKEPVEK